MSLLAITPCKQLALAPTVSIAVLTALSRGEFVGEGTFAAVWKHRDVAVKLTCDRAAIALADRLMHEAVPGLPRVHHLEEDVAVQGNAGYDAVVMELLAPMSARKFAPLQRLYVQCKAAATERYKRVPLQSVYLARLMAQRLPSLRSSALEPEDPQRLAIGLEWLADFMERYGFCADFGHRRNWMVSPTRGVVLADPVVGRICELDAVSTLRELPRG